MKRPYALYDHGTGHYCGIHSSLSEDEVVALNRQQAKQNSDIRWTPVEGLASMSVYVGEMFAA